MPRWDSNPQSQQARGRRPHALYRAATGTGIHIIGRFNTFSEDVYFFTTLSASRTVHLQRRTVGQTCINFQNARGQWVDMNQDP